LLRVGGETVGLVYFRAGYTPRDYPGEKEWGGYRHLELSQAIKCPSIGHHLAGTKKIQQRLSQKGQVERFLAEKDAKFLRTFFADQYSLDGDSSEVKQVETDLLLIVFYFFGLSWCGCLCLFSRIIFSAYFVGLIYRFIFSALSPGRTAGHRKSPRFRPQTTGISPSPPIQIILMGLTTQYFL
jgi:hypothetical protein